MQSLYNATALALNSLPPLKSISDFIAETQEILNEIKKIGEFSAKDKHIQDRTLQQYFKNIGKLLTDSRDWGSSAVKRGH